EADNDASGVNLPELVLPMLGLQPSNTAPSKQAAPVKKEKNQQQQQNNTLTYRNLIGYDSALKAMRKFGFMDAGDNEYKDFVQQAEKFQGVSGPVLSNAFLFRGPSREDTALFATATAGEINPSSIQVSIESDDNSNGVIKVMGPMRRNVWGAPRPADLPDPCVLLVKNIDTLNSFLNGHESNMKGGQRFMGPGGAYEGYSRGSLKSDILMQYNMLRSYHHIVLMATVKDDGEIDPELARIIGPMDVIDVPLPNVDERRDVLIQFAEEHPSFRNLNYRKLAYLSDGMSRHDLVKASQKAVDAAYRESLSTRFHHPVTVNDVLTQFVPYVDHKSATYKKIEDSLIAEFDQEIKILDT
ncbi:MAG: hypothetical protein LBM21_00360, partial [Coriobacteriales bacterium]|nr:hypothetical protein [Coriobacteriales bacterium]